MYVWVGVGGICVFLSLVGFTAGEKFLYGVTVPGLVGLFGFIFEAFHADYIAISTHGGDSVGVSVEIFSPAATASGELTAL